MTEDVKATATYNSLFFNLKLLPDQAGFSIEFSSSHREMFSKTSFLIDILDERRNDANFWFMQINAN